MSYAPNLPARLFRLHGSEADDVRLEEIGSGAFQKMVRIALSDPDGELWRYSVAVNGQRIDGNDLGGFDQIIDREG